MAEKQKNSVNFIAPNGMRVKSQDWTRTAQVLTAPVFKRVLVYSIGGGQV